MAVEAARGCGYREVGGLYMMGMGLGAPCCRLPSKIVPCDKCGATLKRGRNWEWVDPRLALAGSKPVCMIPQAVIEKEIYSPQDPLLALQVVGTMIIPDCPLADTTERMGKRVGLVWVGDKYYSPTSFIEEGKTMGISKRLAMLPKGFDPKNPPWILLVHPKACQGGHKHRWRVKGKTKWRSKWETCKDGPMGLHMADPYESLTPSDPQSLEIGQVEWEHRRTGDPGIFYAFKPSHLELIVTPSMKEKKWVKVLERKGVKLIEVPEDDPDHQRKRRRKLEERD